MNKLSKDLEKNWKGKRIRKWAIKKVGRSRKEI